MASGPRPDLPARLLEYGLAVGLIVAPFPFGGVPAPGRLALELGAFALLGLWLVRSLIRGAALPPRLVSAGLAGLLVLAVAQALPLGAGAAEVLAPRALAIRTESRPPFELRETERRLLDIDPDTLDATASLSFDPGGTASALRTGAALVAVLLVATTVAATCGAGRLALALLFSAAFQGLYGLLVLASGHDHIWHLPKKHFLDSATGTFVNPNHFAGLLAMSLPCGLALIGDRLQRRGPQDRRGSLAAWLSGEGARVWLLALLFAMGLAGLLLSYSRAGIALGLLACGLTLVATARPGGVKLRLVIALLVAAAAAVPLLQIGTERLIARYADTPEELGGARLRVWADSLSLVRAQPLTGCGFGAFAASYPLVRSQEIRRLFVHVHNDFLQTWVEGGALGGGLLLIVLLPLGSVAVRTLAGAKGPLAVGFAAGLAAVLLHSLVDFSFHMPANAATAAALAGVLLGLPWKRPS